LAHTTTQINRVEAIVRAKQQSRDEVILFKVEDVAKTAPLGALLKWDEGIYAVRLNDNPTIWVTELRPGAETVAWTNDVNSFVVLIDGVVDLLGVPLEKYNGVFVPAGEVLKYKSKTGGSVLTLQS